ncbi:hypothetical protein NC651_026353 [Populus alba x Populus x berolinensis]|nr:hypothetical protein NC651_026353 [Populus alba x Populus x berolinensis]
MVTMTKSFLCGLQMFQWKKMILAKLNSWIQEI